MNIRAILQLPIRTRFILGMMLMLLPLLVLSATAFYAVNKSTLALEAVVEETTKEVNPVFHLQRSIIRAAMPANDFIITGEEKEKERFLALSNEIDRAFEAAMSLPFGHPEEGALIRKSRDEWLKAKALSHEIFATTNQADNLSASGRMVALDSAIDRAADTLNQIIEPAYAEMEEHLLVAKDMRWKTNLIIMTVSGVCLLIAFAVGMTLAVSIILPVQTLKKGANRLGEGDLSHRITLDNRDELGQLAAVFNGMAEKLETNMMKLEDLATHDGLTGLFNNREFYRRLKEEFTRSRRTGHELSLLLIDIDHFKAVNDTFGHQAGDEVLRAVGAMIYGSIRKTDFAARYGGEEFAVFLTDTPRDGARVLAEKIRAMIGKQPLAIGSRGESVTVTVSIGISSFSDKHASEQEMVAEADHAMYRAKNSGRNMVCLADAA